MGLPKIVKEIFKAYIKAIVDFAGARWISPRDSRDDPECAVVELDLNLKPEAINWIGIFLLLLRNFDRRINTDHPVFRYLGESGAARRNAEVSLTISVRRRGAQVKPTEGSEGKC